MNKSIRLMIGIIYGPRRMPVCPAGETVGETVELVYDAQVWHERVLLMRRFAWPIGLLVSAWAFLSFLV